MIHSKIRQISRDFEEFQILAHEMHKTRTSLDEQKYIFYKILPDSCKIYESAKIRAEKFISCKILANDVNLARILQKT